jgi:hypothetical protein
MNREQQDTERALLAAIGGYLNARGWSKTGAFWSHPQLGGNRFRDWDALSETRSRPMFFGGGLR